MLKSGGQLELTGVITIELASFHPSTATIVSYGVNGMTLFVFFIVRIYNFRVSHTYVVNIT
jgi:hypothetical protein